MSKLLDATFGSSGLSVPVEADATGSPPDGPRLQEINALAEALSGLASLSEGQRRVLLPEGASCEHVTLDTDRTMTELRLQDGTLSVFRSLGEEALLFAWFSGQGVAVKPCGEIMESAALNLGDLLVQALVCGSRHISFDLAFVQAMGEETLGILDSFRRQLALENDSWGVAFWNIPGGIRPILTSLEQADVGKPRGENTICLCSET